MMPVAAFVLAPVKFGVMIVNRFDATEVSPGWAVGVGHELLSTGEYQAEEANVLLTMLYQRRDRGGDGVVVIDCGANIGAHTVRWARAIEGWGSVIAIEPQERVFYALAGNIAINNCFNVRAMHAAVGSGLGKLEIPELDSCQSANFGGLHIKRDVDGDNFTTVDVITIDSLALERLDLLKIDVESMEPEVLDGSQETIARCRPVVYAEYHLCGIDPIKQRLAGYRFYTSTSPKGDANVLCMPEEGP